MSVGVKRNTKPKNEAMLEEAQDRHILPPRMKRLWALLIAAAPKEGGAK